MQAVIRALQEGRTKERAAGARDEGVDEQAETCLGAVDKVHREILEVRQPCCSRSAIFGDTGSSHQPQVLSSPYFHGRRETRRKKTASVQM